MTDAQQIESEYIKTEQEKGAAKQAFFETQAQQVEESLKKKRNPHENKSPRGPPDKKKRNRKPPEIPIEWASDIQLAQRYSVSRATIWRWVTEGNLPKPKKLGANCTRWRLSEVIEALEG